MKNRLLAILILLSVNLSGQKSNTIEMNTKFTLELQTEDSLTYTFKVASKEPFTGEFEWEKGMSYLDSVLSKNQVQGILTNGKFGNQTNSILLVKSGLDKLISYKLKIKVPKKRKPIKTSVLDLSTNVPSIEIWPYTVESIQFSDLTTAPKRETPVFKPRIDSSCIKNKDLNIEYGKRLFVQHSNWTVERFKSGLFELSELLEFEDSLKTKDVSRTNYWDLGKGIYPNDKNFIFGIPVSYQRLECPYFKGTVDFFYTKKEKSVKVVAYEWGEFRKSGFSDLSELESDNMNKAFKEKYDFVFTEISRVLGEPISNVTEGDKRRQTKWKSKDGINAYLFNFSSINQIRLYIYKE